MKAEDKLFPCPFCGGKARILPYQPPKFAGLVQDWNWNRIDCIECGAAKISASPYLSQAVAEWNKRWNP